MNKTQSRFNLSRRDFLKYLAATGAAVAGGNLLNTYAPWMDYDEQIKHTLRPFERDTSISTQMLEIVRYATLAASGHNTQPWKFAIKENTIEIHPDYTRRLPVVDPDDRELWISLGCALENLLVSARAIGYAPEITYPDTANFIRVHLQTDTPRSTTLFNAIPLRQTTRSEYDGQPIKTADFDQVRALPLEPSVALHFVTEITASEIVLEYVNQGNLNQIANEALVDELIDWLRFNKKEALTSLDGLYSRCSGNPEVPGWFGRMFVSSMKPEQQADVDTRKLRSSSGTVIISSTSDERTAWVRTGQVFERLALTMTSLDLKSGLMNQPIEDKELRSQFQSAMGMGRSFPQLLVRFGYAPPLPRSLRRPVEEVIL